jgi:3-methyl-2-oxobutanoate hydroxymethyltransferase
MNKKKNSADNDLLKKSFAQGDSMTQPDKITVPRIIEMKGKGEKIVCLTAYDCLIASLFDASGIEIILVGDSAAMVFAGHDTTLPITMDQMLYHTRAVTRGVKRALVIADMPFLSFQITPEQAIENAGRFLQQGRAAGVKIEGGEPVAETIRKIVDIGIPVMGHLGLTPQSIQAFGGYRLRGKSEVEADTIRRDAKSLEQAGVFAMVLEKIPSSLAAEVTKSVSIPTIGIGAGPRCDGQILVSPDMLGLFEAFKPKFVRQYANLAESIRKAASGFMKDVKSGDYPSKEESY